MKIKIGTDNDGRRVMWNTETSPLLSVYASEPAGSSELVGRIMEQACRSMAVLLFGGKDTALPTAAITYVDGSNPKECRESLESVRAEQSRRADSINEDTRPILVVVDDFDGWCGKNADPDNLRLLSELMQNCRRTLMCMVITARSYERCSSGLRGAIRQTGLCDAGSHVLIGSSSNVGVLHRQNMENAEKILTDADGTGGASVFESNTGVLSVVASA